jgi:hypothetical protein
MQVIKPVDDCSACQAQFKELKTFYGMYKACPSDPGATGLLQGSLETYRAHHKDVHPVHPDAMKPEGVEREKQ